MSKWLLAVLLATVAFDSAPEVHGQQSEQRIFGRGTGRRATIFGGRADRIETVSPQETRYLGNVSIFFQDANIVLQADEVTLDRASEQLTVTGNVRVILDSAGLMDRQ